MAWSTTNDNFQICKKIGKDKSLVHRYINEGVKPKDDVLKKIFFETLGVVNANDFSGLSYEELEEYIRKKRKTPQEELHADSFKWMSFMLNWIVRLEFHSISVLIK